MTFNSIEFFTTFLIALLVYYVIPRKMQWGYLLGISYLYYFYTSTWYTILLLFSTIVTYIMARMIENNARVSLKKFLLGFGIILNIGILFFFKYSPWILESVQQVSDKFSLGVSLPEFSFLVPLGISFYTFKVVGYISDVYNGKISAEKNFGKYALYVSFFPQIISGPIERSYNFIPQLEKGYRFEYEKVKNGFLLFLWGLLKKIVIADRLGILVDEVFDNVMNYGTPAYIIAILFFSMQIYFDFSGYSDMAIGCTNMLGITSIRNFDRPYFSKSIGEFWRRWHMSLSTWFRDYLYIPLGGNRVSKVRWACNTMIVFLTSGLWHGANWTFIIWGALHGIYQIIGKFSRDERDKLLNKMCIRKDSKLYLVGASVGTFLLTTYAWMFFRANSISDALHITKYLISWDVTGFNIFNLGLEKYDFLFAIGILALWFVIEMVQEKIELRKWLQQRCLPIRWLIYLTKTSHT